MRLLHLQTIIAATDLTATSDAPLRSAVALAAAAGAALHVAHVAPADTGIIAYHGRRAEFLHELAAATKRADVPDTHTPHVLTGESAAAIASLAERIGADVIVTGRRRADAAVAMHRPLGGTAYAIITRSSVPCLAITERLDMPLRRVLVAIDKSEASHGALLVGLAWASALRKPRGGPPVLTALHVHDETDGAAERAQQAVDQELEAVRAEAGDWAAVTVSGVTVPGAQPVGTIAEVADRTGADLIVLGTRGLRLGDAEVLGSVSAAVLGRVSAPVLLVPPAIWRNQVDPTAD
ncbi:MAG: universal stress protein [Gemmatimonadaceae bacterium]